MSIIRINRQPSRSQLAVFGATWLAFFAAFGGMAAARGGWTAAVGLWIAAAVVPAVGWPVPRFLRLVYLGMCYAAFPIGFVVSHVVLAALYFGVIAPIGLVMRACGRDPMQRRFDRDAASYWVSRETHPALERYFRQS